MVDSIAAATAEGSSAAAVGTWAGAGWSGGEVAEAGSGNSIVGVGIAPVEGLLDLVHIRTTYVRGVVREVSSRRRRRLGC